MGFFHFLKKFILGFFFSGLTAEDRIFLRWGYMLSPRLGGGGGGTNFFFFDRKRINLDLLNKPKTTFKTILTKVAGTNFVADYYKWDHC